MTQEELQKCYDHCLSMLYNKGRSAPGKHEVKKNIERLYVNCNAELFMRYLMHDLDIEFLKTRKGIIDHLNNAKRDLGLTLESTIDNVFNNVPPVFKTLTINNVLDACLDKLDVLNKKLISDKFILDQGVWLTKKERKEFTEYDEEGNKRNFIEVMKERLFIDGVYIKTSPRGFSYNEFRLLIELPEFPKISSLSTDVLKLLRNKVILLVDNDNNRQIDR